MADIENLEDEEWKFDVQKNLSYLTEHTEDLMGILTRLIQHKINSKNEMQYILNEQHNPTNAKKTFELLTNLKSKGWRRVKGIFLQILRDTLNDNCADLIQFGCTQRATTSAEIINRTEKNNEKHSIQAGKRAKIAHSPDCNYSTKTLIMGAINSKWWPEELKLPTSFLERKIENELLTEKLKKMLIQNRNKTTVINQHVAVSGLGGIGKTTTAKSFAITYAGDYDLILWIDCGEGSLLKSFTKLARDLDLPKREELELKELACRSFEILKESKCLFIFDNAECYVGKEGIRDVLPKNHDKFHIVITSRSRHWGEENIDGKIPEFPLDVFGEDEGLNFLKTNMKNLEKDHEMKIKSICVLLGYLPLALQIAVSTLNEHEISLDTYIKELQTNDDVLHSELDGYERTINKTLKITLELIRNHKRKNVGELAIKILSIFGYITPDAVVAAFFKALSLERNQEFDEATKLLQLYSIISIKSVKYNDLLETFAMFHGTFLQEFKYTFSIHRLFQQVVRHNTKETQNQILRQIFNCEGFLDYKLIPFTYYANEELQKEFPKLKAELLDKVELEKLVKRGRFQEAVGFSRLIKDSIQTPVSLFNFALCLKYNNEREEAKKTLLELLKNTKRRANTNKVDATYLYCSLIINSDTKLTFDLVTWELFLIYCEEKDEEAARQIFRSATQMKLEECSFNSSVLSLLPQSLQKLELCSCTISNGSSPTSGGIPLPPKLKELNLVWNKFVDDDGKELTSLDISQLIPLNLNRLDISDSICVSLDRIKLIPSVDFCKCSLILVPGLYITPQELTLRDVEFFAANKEKIGNVLVNDFVDFRQMNELNLIGSDVSIDLCDPLTLNCLFLSGTKVVDWKKANWTVHKLELSEVDFIDRTGMKATEMEIWNSSVDISALPSTIQKLTLEKCTLVNFSFSVADNKLLPNLKELHLLDIKINEDENYANNDDLLRVLVPNCDKWEMSQDMRIDHRLICKLK